MSKIEAELLKATGEKDQGGREDRQDFLVRLVEAAYGLPEKKWDALTAEAQEWVNGAVKQADNKEEIDDVPDGGEPEPDERPARSSRGGKKDEEDDDRGSSRGRGRDDDRDDDRGSRSRGRDDDDRDSDRRGSRDDDRRSSRDDDRDDRRRDDRDDDRRGSRDRDDDRGGRSSRDRDDRDDDRGSRGRDRDDDRDSRSSRGRDDDEGGSRSGRSSRSRDDGDDGDKGGGDGEENVSAALKVKIKNIILDNPAANVDAILKALDSKVTVSKTVVSAIRTEFRHSLKVIQDKKLLKKAIL